MKKFLITVTTLLFSSVSAATAGYWEAYLTTSKACSHRGNTSKIE